MILKKYEDLPEEFHNDEVYTYYTLLQQKRVSLAVKRVFDVFAALILLIILSPVILIIAVAIKLDSPGPVIFKQERVTKYGKKFKIYKFRTMVVGADKGSQVTVNNDSRITKTGNFLRKFRLDEFLQLVNILKGDMSFVGTRPEVQKYVDAYTEPMYATLLLPAGVTSLASIKYKDEDKLLSESDNTDYTYINEILPQKMEYNLEYIENFSFFYDIKLMFMTVFAVVKKDEVPLKEVEEEVVEKV